jgi:hypothetical protein
MARTAIALLGTPMITEEGEATEAITPGYIVEGQGSISISDDDGTKIPMRVALERDELGDGIDDAYAIGDTVKVGHFHAGQRFYGFIASGQNITASDLLEAAGDGTLEGVASGVPVARAVESVNATNPGDTRIRVEVI